MSAFDAVAPTFDRHRALPDGATKAIRAALLGALDARHPRLLDLGAGTGRVGWPFVEAEDDYVGVDLSLGMLRAFRQRTGQRNGQVVRLVQANGEHLPFDDATFDAVMLIQVLGGVRGWRRLLAEARRVLASTGALVVGRTLAPDDGVDVRMKQRLALILDEMNVQSYRTSAREGAQRWLDRAARGTRVVVATWSAERTPRGFLERHRTGAQFSALPESVKDEALRKLGTWAAAAFGSLDTALREQHMFELQVFRFS